MKIKLIVVVLFIVCCFSINKALAQTKTENIILVTLDGLRWQEIFEGADSALINNPKYSADTLLTKLQYWDTDVIERRKKLMPFFWNVIARKG